MEQASDVVLVKLFVGLPAAFGREGRSLVSNMILTLRPCPGFPVVVECSSNEDPNNFLTLKRNLKAGSLGFSKTTSVASVELWMLLRESRCGLMISKLSSSVSISFKT